MSDFSTPSPLDPDSLPVAIIQLSQERKVEALNAPAEVLFGVSRKAAVGKTLREINRIDPGLDVLIDRSVKTGGLVSDPAFKLRGPNISSTATQNTSVRVSSQNKIIMAFLPNPSATSDHDGIYSLANFGSMLGHEVKNPLAGLSGAAQLLLRQARDDQKELLQLILQECKRITRLVDELSAFELFSRPKPEAYNIHATLDRVISSEQIASQSAVSIERNFDPSLPLLWVDKDHIHEVFQNLIRNACEALEEQGDRADKKVTVRTRFSLDNVTSRQGLADNVRFAKISISDNGPGITGADKHRIFEMFHTSKPEGTGLGLTIANQIVKAHHGHLNLESEPGHTEFSVYLPFASI